MLLFRKWRDNSVNDGSACICSHVVAMWVLIILLLLWSILQHEPLWWIWFRCVCSRHDVDRVSTLVRSGVEMQRVECQNFWKCTNVYCRDPWEDLIDKEVQVVDSNLCSCLCCGGEEVCWNRKGHFSLPIICPIPTHLCTFLLHNARNNWTNLVLIWSLPLHTSKDCLLWTQTVCWSWRHLFFNHPVVFICIGIWGREIWSFYPSTAYEVLNLKELEILTAIVSDLLKSWYDDVHLQYLYLF